MKNHSQGTLKWFQNDLEKYTIGHSINIDTSLLNASHRPVGHLRGDDCKLRLDTAWNVDKPLLILNINGKTTLDNTATLFNTEIIIKLIEKHAWDETSNISNSQVKGEGD